MFATKKYIEYNSGKYKIYVCMLQSGSARTIIENLMQKVPTYVCSVTQ